MKKNIFRGKATSQTFHHLPVSATSESSKKPPRESITSTTDLFQTQTHLHPRGPLKYSRPYKATVVFLNVKRDITFIADPPQGDQPWLLASGEMGEDVVLRPPRTKLTVHCILLFTGDLNRRGSTNWSKLFLLFMMWGFDFETIQTPKIPSFLFFQTDFIAVVGYFGKDFKSICKSWMRILLASILSYSQQESSFKTTLLKQHLIVNVFLFI